MTISTNDQADALANELTHYKRLDAASAIISSSTKWSVVAVLFGTLAPAGAAHYALTSSAKFIPGYVSAVSAVTLATFGAAATYAIGKVFVRHFENGGTFDNFSATEIRLI